jgi:hypothetical protein
MPSFFGKMMGAKKKFLILLVAALAIGCGRRDDPRPPVPIVPQATSDLVVAQLGPDVVLSWSYPALTVAGGRLVDVRRLVVSRYVEQLPPQAAERLPQIPTEAATDPAVQLFDGVPQIAADHFIRLREVIAHLEGDAIPQHTGGARIYFRDDAQFGATGAPVRVTYAVSTVGREAESALSNLVSIVPLETTGPPQNVTASATPQGVRLQWEAPAEGEAAALAGYNVYRFPPEGSIFDLGAPVHGEPIPNTDYLDIPPFGAWRYAVTAVRHAGPPRIESRPTPTVYTEFADLVAPPQPEGVVTLMEEAAVRVVWDPVVDPALLGYHVYRTAGNERIRLTQQPISETSWRDTTLQRGVRYVYSVTSIDRSDNESEPGESAPILLPR